MHVAGRVEAGALPVEVELARDRFAGPLADPFRPKELQERR